MPCLRKNLPALFLLLGAVQPAAAGPDDTAAVYQKFLGEWTGGKGSTDVANEAEPLSLDELKKASDCLGKDAPARWESPGPTQSLAEPIGRLSYTRLVDRKTWEPHDPRKSMAQGKSVDAAVDEGFDHGLLTLSGITFNDQRDTAVFSYSFLCGMLCGSHALILYKKSPDGWQKVNKQCDMWIS